MLKKRYTCDGGSICIGTVDARVQIPNCYGDGEHTIFIYNGNEQVPDNTEFRGAIEGDNIQVFDYDGYSTQELNLIGNKVLFNLQGRFGIYAVKDTGDMILQKWA